MSRFERALVAGIHYPNEQVLRREGEVGEGEVMSAGRDPRRLLRALTAIDRRLTALSGSNRHLECGTDGISPASRVSSSFSRVSSSSSPSTPLPTSAAAPVSSAPASASPVLERAGAQRWWWRMVFIASTASLDKGAAFAFFTVFAFFPSDILSIAFPHI